MSSRRSASCRWRGVSRDDLVDFLAGLYRLNLESRTVARHLVTLRNFFRFAQTQELIATTLRSISNRQKFGASLPGYLRLEEVERLLEQPDQTTALGVRDRAMLEVLYSTGLRVSELIGLKSATWTAKLAVCAASAKAIRNASCRWAARPWRWSKNICAKRGRRCSK